MSALPPIPRTLRSLPWKRTALFTLLGIGTFLLLFGTDILAWMNEQRTLGPRLELIRTSTAAADEHIQTLRGQALSTADAQLKAGALEGARQALQAQLARDLDAADLYLKLSAVHLEQGDIRSAYATLREGAVRQPKDPQLLYQIAVIDLLDHNLPAAKEVAERLQKLGTAPRETALLQADLAAAENRVDDAIRAMAQALRATADPLELRWIAFLAHLYVRKGEPAAAEQLLATHVTSAASADDLLSLAKYFLSIHDGPRATQYFEQAVRQYPKSAEAAYAYAESLADAGAPQHAAAYYERALALRPDLPLFRFNAGRNALVLKHLPEAKAYADRLLAGAPQHPLGLRLKAQVEYAQGRRADAVVTLTTLATLYPKAPGPHILLASIALQHGELAVAEHQARTASTLGDTTITPHVLLANVASKRGQHAMARDELLEVLRLTPTYLPGILQLGDTYLNLGQVTEAEAQYAKAAALAPELKGVGAKLAWAKGVKGENAEALALAQESWRSAPDDPTVLLTYINSLILNRRLPEATALAVQQSKQHPTEWRIAFMLGDLWFLQHQRDKGTAEYQRALSLDPQDATLVLNVAARLVERDLPQDAERVLVQFLSKNPRDVLVANQLAWLYTETLNAPARAVPLLDVLRLAPQEPTVLDTLGWYYHKTGNRTSAENYLRTALRLDPTNQAIQGHLAAVTGTPAGQ